jgi:Arc/MetJ-type ribon-helix-helix transcriptional regulator
MKLSVSLPDADVEFLDDYVASSGVLTRSAALQRAVRLLRATSLGPSYEAAWLEWGAQDDADAWDVSTDDGLH